MPVAIGFLSPAVLRPGGLAVGASSKGIRDIWVYLEPLAREKARRIFTARLCEGNSAPGAVCDTGARAVLGKALQELEAYFLGKLRMFTCPLDLDGRGTPFQAKVWDALRGIPYGKTCSYGAIARAVGRPRAFRAVGGGCGKNPIPVIIPCHRVVGADGSLTGFSGGLELKSLLLSLEDVQRAEEGCRLRSPQARLPRKPQKGSVSP